MGNAEGDAMNTDQKIAHLTIAGWQPTTYKDAWYGMHNGNIFHGMMNTLSHMSFTMLWAKHLEETNVPPSCYECSWDKIPEFYIQELFDWERQR